MNLPHRAGGPPLAMGPVTRNGSCSRRTVHYLADICWQISERRRAEDLFGAAVAVSQHAVVGEQIGGYFACSQPTGDAGSYCGCRSALQDAAAHAQAAPAPGLPWIGPDPPGFHAGVPASETAGWKR